MSKHTPGPWEIVETTDPKTISSWKIHMGSHSIDFFPYVYQFADVEKTRGGYIRDIEMYDNARLIAAAPELLEALEFGRTAIGEHIAPSDCYATGPLTGNYVEDLIVCPACRFISAYEKAIAKAKGE